MLNIDEPSLPHQILPSTYHVVVMAQTLDTRPRSKVNCPVKKSVLYQLH